MIITPRMLAAFLIALIVTCVSTPFIKILAEHIGAIDVPKDGRRMHVTPVARLGGLAIFIGFCISVLINYQEMDLQFVGILGGALILVVLGIFDDIYDLNPWIKLLVQTIAAVVPVACGIVVTYMTNFTFIGSNQYIHFGILSAPITIIWIVGMINAVNWIDGLDGLAAGVSCIASLSMFLIAVMIGDPSVALILITVAGACLGFLPFNLNPAKIFMGDTGSMFLGYILAVMSVQGLFKFYAIVSFAVPFLVLGLPLFDSVFTIIRRLHSGKSPFYADRGHVHHRLIDMGLNQKQAVTVLYAVSIAMGITAVVLTTSGEIRALLFVITLVLASVTASAIYATADKHRHNGNKEDKKEDKEHGED